ncbi:MAG: acyl-CoA thioesterase [Bdellovibrionales bacterium]
MFYYDLIIREHHLDSYGHVNNATYVQILEEARWEDITQRGYGYEKVQETQIGPVILEVSVKFRKELKLREKVKVTVETQPMRGKIGVINQTILKEDGSVALEGYVTYGMFDLKARKLIEATPEWLQAIKA